MRKVISIEVDWPKVISTDEFRVNLKSKIVADYDIKVYDIWDGVDERPQASDAPIEKLLSGIGQTMQGVTTTNG